LNIIKECAAIREEVKFVPDCNLTDVLINKTAKARLEMEDKISAKDKKLGEIEKEKVNQHFFYFVRPRSEKEIREKFGRVKSFQ
jgi:hypothetical protein